MSRNMTDFIIGVNSAQEWHTDNLASHPGHYSGLARLAGPGWVTRWQQELGAQFYFNTLVPWRDKASNVLSVSSVDGMTYNYITGSDQVRSYKSG